jgi:deoxycytidylate deaminase
MYNKHIHYLLKAKGISELSDFKPHKIGCILVYKKQVISVGYNTNKSHPIQKEYNSFRELRGASVNHKAHAEMICIHRATKLDIDLSKCTLYIFRQHKNGTWAMARPCMGCEQYIRDQKIKKVIYTTDKNSYILEEYL